MKALSIVLGWLIGLITVFWRWSCPIKHQTDSRQPYLEKREPFIVALLHAHMIAGVLGRVAPHCVVMVSRSADGDLIAPSVQLAGMLPVRGSSSKKGKRKGGGEALAEMATLLENESYNPILTVDGPRGPRNFVHRGVAILAMQHGCPVIPLTPLASRYRTLDKSWDKTHIPLPFSTIDMHWGEPIHPQKDESPDAFRLRVGKALREAELRHNPQEAQKLDDEAIRFI